MIHLRNVGMWGSWRRAGVEAGVVRTKETADQGPHIIKFFGLMHNAENPLTMAQRISMSLKRLEKALMRFIQY